MKEAKIIFTLNEVNTIIQCSKDDKINDICLKYSLEINKDKANLLFLYEGKKINFDLNFNEQATIFDKNKNEMKIDVYEKENNINCPKCGKTLKFIEENINEIRLCNNVINDNINEFKLQIKAFNENSLINSNKIILNNINEILIALSKNIIKNNEKLINLLSYNNFMFNKNISFNKNNNNGNENNLRNGLDIKLNEIKENKDISESNNIDKSINLNKKKLYEKIKSRLIYKIIFSNMNERIKLKTMKYNKKLQKKLNINLIYYKYFLGRYIIYETKSKGKEYNSSDKLIFSGEYMNGERHGKGKVYNNKGQLAFEGEYLKGKRSGYGKDYYDNGKLYYEGQYLNNERNGYGKEYYKDGELRLEGEFKNDDIWNGKIFDKNNNLVSEIKNGNGLVKIYDNDGHLSIEGEFLNGKINGKGMECYNDGKLKFEGEFKGGKKWKGKGYDMSNNIIYEIKDGKGKIKEYNNDNNLEFECEYLNGERNGKGKEYYENGELRFEGEYLNGERNRKGKDYYENGELRFEGYYLYHYKIKGKEFFEGKLEYEGEYLYNLKWKGKGYDKDGNVIYELNNGKGKLKLYNQKSQLIFEGEIKNGKSNGKGKEYKDDKCIFYGEYLNGRRWEGIGIKIEIYEDDLFCEKKEEIFEFEYLGGIIQKRYLL